MEVVVTGHNFESILQYVCWRWPSWMEVRVTGHNFENWPLKDHPCHVCFKLAYWFQRKRFLNIFPIGSYVKTMFADGCHLGWRSGSQDIILKVDHLRTIHSHVCFKLTYWFQRRRLLNIGPMLKLCPLTAANLDRDRGHIFGSWPPKDNRWHVCYIGWLVSGEKILKHFFPIRSYVKTMSADGGHLGWRSVSLDIILAVDHLRTIHAMFVLNWLIGFRGEDF